MKIEAMTLTDFLLARIAEDEDAAQYGAEATVGAWGGDRVLVECDAKRRIVAWLSDWQADVRDEGLRILAAVHADHPDYRPEWRP